MNRLSMNRLSIILMAVVLCAPNLVSADIIVNGSTTAAALGDGVIANGYSTTPPNSFNNNFLVLFGNEASKESDAVSLSQLDVVTAGSTQYLRFAFDSQETNSNEKLTLSDLTIEIYAASDTTFQFSTLLWDFADASHTNGIVVNDDQNDLTHSPLGNGADVEFLIPRSLFNGTSFVGADKLRLTASAPAGAASDRQNGADEFGLWTGAGGVFLGAGDLVGTTAVPEPSSMIWLAGLSLILVNRRRKTTQ